MPFRSTQCEVFGDATSGTDYVIKDVADRVEDKKSDHKSDLAMVRTRYPDGTFCPGREAWTLSEDDIAKSTAAEARKPYLAQIAWAWLICAIEVKSSLSQDPFDDSQLKRTDTGGGAGVEPKRREGDTRWVTGRSSARRARFLHSFL